MRLNGNTVVPAYIGINNTPSFRIFTEGTRLASFTYGNSMTSPICVSTGDRLRIFNATNPLFTTGGGRTHVQFGINGSVNGTGTTSRTRMDYINGAGFWFNATGGRAIWNIGGKLKMPEWK